MINPLIFDPDTPLPIALSQLTESLLDADQLNPDAMRTHVRILAEFTDQLSSLALKQETAPRARTKPTTKDGCTIIPLFTSGFQLAQEHAQSRKDNPYGTQ